MPSRLKIDHDSLTDNDRERQIEFIAEIDSDDREFAVKYAVLTELSGDEPENDALDLFERFSDELTDVCLDVAARSTADVIVITASDLE